MVSIGAAPPRAGSASRSLPPSGCYQPERPAQKDIRPALPVTSQSGGSQRRTRPEFFPPPVQDDCADAPQSPARYPPPPCPPARSSANYQLPSVKWLRSLLLDSTRLHKDFRKPSRYK